METRFLAVVAGLSLVLLLACLHGRRLRSLLWWRTILRRFEQMPVVMRMFTKAATQAMTSADEFSGAMKVMAEWMPTTEETAGTGRVLKRTGGVHRLDKSLDI